MSASREIPLCYPVPADFPMPTFPLHSITLEDPFYKESGVVCVSEFPSVTFHGPGACGSLDC